MLGAIIGGTASSQAATRARPAGPAPQQAGTSRRCRAGAATAARSGPSPRSGTPGRQRPGVELLDVARACAARRRPRRRSRRGAASRSRRRPHRPGGRAAAPRPAARAAARSAAARRGLPPPARLGAAAQRAEPGARRVDQHPVEGAVGQPGRPRPSRDVHVDRQPVGTACRTSSARCRRSSTASTVPPRWRGQRAEQRGLAAGAGAQVEPARSSAPSSGAPARASAHSWLPSSCTRGAAARARRRSVAGSPPPARCTPYGEYGPRLAAGHQRPAPSRSTGRAGRPGAPPGGRRRRPAPRRALGEVAAERVGERLRRSTAGGRAQRQVADRVVVGAGASRSTHAVQSCSATRRSTALTNPAAPAARLRPRPGRRSWRPRRAAAPGCAAAGRRPAAARRARRRRSARAAGRRTRRSRVEQARGRAACRRRARWRTRRRGRRSRRSRRIAGSARLA